MVHANSGYSTHNEEVEYMAFTPNEYTQNIWDYLRDYSPFTEEGIAALMGNMWAESGCTPYACQPSRPKNICLNYIEKVDNNQITRSQFIHGGCSSTGGYTSTQLGFGLCQWTITSRKTGLYDHVFPNYPTMTGTIGDLYKQLEYVLEEISPNTGFRSVYNVLTTSHNINECSDIVLEVYENPEVQTQAVHELRQTYSRQVYNEYSGTSGSYLISINTYGNGVASVDDYTPTSGQIVTLNCVPDSGETLDDIIARTTTGQSMALDPTLLTQTFTMPPNDIIINVYFSGSTPPIPTGGTREHHMPIWEYPIMRC